SVVADGDVVFRLAATPDPTLTASPRRRNSNNRDGQAMEEALGEFLHHLSAEKNASAHTTKSYREDLVQALEFFRCKLSTQKVEMRQINARLLRAYLARMHEQGYAKTTMARRIAAVRSLCRFLCRQGMLS